MYLKSIEIQGFKSFAKKTTLEFKNGITGIVGPNGSGKSNVADALRWVLGEQKVKSLRGSKMEDVIFAGTKKRNPLSFAYVAITFDNSDGQLAADFSEIKIARKLYRSGESEYLLNGSSVRLKDIKELFYDTGIGKEGYSIIGQGQIDKILQNKSDERRELFDEACGIVKYKKRKAIALRKLENEKIDHERACDIASELEKRLPALKRQSETANLFLNYKNELKRLDINLFLCDHSRLNEKISECDKNLMTARGELKEASKELEDIKLEHEKASLALSALDSKIEELNRQISQSNIVKENLLGRINVLNEQINSASESEKLFSGRIDEIKASLNEAEEEKASLAKDQEENLKLLEDISLKRQSKSSELIKLQNEIAELNETLGSLKEELVENIQDNGVIQAKSERLSALREQLEETKKRLEQTLKGFTEDKTRHEEKIKELSLKANDQETFILGLEKKAKNLSEKINSLEHDEELLNRQISSLSLDKARAFAKLESVRNITERYEGYSSAIKEVMALKSKNKGIIGVVADIIKAPKEYETAVETALGASIQNIVTDNENTAKEAIEYLKKNKYGRATFLPLKAIKNRGGFKNEQAFDEEGALGPASSLVHVDPEFTDLNDFLLGRILVADNIDNALKIARKYRYSFIIVTLEGELLSRGGALSGGAYKNRSSLLGRRREIEELEKEISSLEEAEKEAARKISLLQNDKKKDSDELSALTEKIQSERLILNTLNVNLSREKADEDILTDSYKLAAEESKKAGEDEALFAVQKESCLKELEENEAENLRIKEKIALFDEKLKEEKDAESELLASTGALDIEYSNLKQQQSFIVSSLIKAENSVSRLALELSSAAGSAEGSAKGIEEKKAEIEEINASVKRAADEISRFSIKLADLTDERQEAKAGGGDFLIRHDELSQTIASLDKEVFRLEQQREKYEEQLGSASDHIWNEYELTYNGALAFKDDSLNKPSEMKGEISSLKTKIRGLGTINTASIDEYREVKERYDFLSDQIADIKKAEDDILKLIRDLDRQMKAKFREEFSRISEEFSRVFSIMFGGGTGTLLLSDEEDILESDIEINAQPPGKKLQNMMQLSGGEKALTAIAVLFSIQNLKPSPFCILDEIEAALDDSNISRFANYLVLLSGKIQFIVITHRKGTMEVCNRLYGITMPEKGVSAMVSVSLEEAQESLSEEEDIK